MIVYQYTNTAVQSYKTQDATPLQATYKYNFPRVFLGGGKRTYKSIKAMRLQKYHITICPKPQKHESGCVCPPRFGNNRLSKVIPGGVLPLACCTSTRHVSKTWGVRSMPMERRSSKVFFSTTLLEKNSRKNSRTAAVGKKEKNV